MPPTTLLEWLVKHYPGAKKQTLRRMMQCGRVVVNGRPSARANMPLASDDRIEVLEASPATTRNAPGLLKVVFEDQDILVVDKPPGLLTSTGPRESRQTLLALVQQYLAEREPRARVGLIHRLDRDASGLLIFSKNDAAYRSLKAQFLKHTVTREYRAVVHGKPDPPAACIENRLVERADGTVHRTRQVGKGQRAVTEYEVVRSDGKLSLLRVVLHTGRKHQIRVHLQEKGTPVVGDRVYGSADGSPRLMLAAVRLSIRHPRKGASMTFSLPTPKAFTVGTGNNPD